MIYFVTARELGRVKIGFSNKPRTRFSKMRTDSPVPLELERICEGSLYDESALHDRFQAHRINREWFLLADEIEAHMATLPLHVHRRTESLSAYTDLAAKAKISASYAFEILNGTRRPSQAMALQIYDATGLKFGPLALLRKSEIETVRKVTA